MRHTLALGKREIIAYFLSPVGYVVGALFIALYNIFFSFWIYAGLAESPDANQIASLGIWFVALFSLLAIPFLTMGLLADEKRSGTIEMLMTAPVADWEVVLGKYLGSITFIICLIIPSVFQAVFIAHRSSPLAGPIVSGYMGLAFLVLLLAAIGLFFSSISKSPLVSVMLSFVAFIVLYVGLPIVNALVSQSQVVKADGMMANVVHYAMAFLAYASLYEHFSNFLEGQANSRDIIYFLSGTAFFLFLSTLAVESRKWK